MHYEIELKDESSKRGRVLFPFIYADANLSNWTPVIENSDEELRLSCDIQDRNDQL